MVLVGRDERWRMPGWLWERDEPLLPEPPFHPSGCQRLRGAHGDGRDPAHPAGAVYGMQWNALDATRICSSSSAHRRFREWERASAFAEF